MTIRTDTVLTQLPYIMAYHVSRHIPRVDSFIIKFIIT